MMTSQNKKILIVSVRAGAGHLKAAEALEASLKINRPDLEIKNIDLLDHSTALMKFLYGRVYLDIVKALPELYAYSYKHYESAKNFVKPRLLLDKINLSDFLKIVDGFNPDLIIATHFIAASVVANYKIKQNKTYSIALTLTDYEYHPLWLVDGVNLFFCATQEVKSSLVFYGVPSGKIIASGIPVHPKFSQTKDKNFLRKKYGLIDKSPALLISAGSFGITPLDEVIDDFKKIKSDFQIMVVCGKNEKLKTGLESKKTNEPRFKQIFGFIDFMDELMAASDILITKPGGITVSEALASKLPMILIEPIPGQEEANADYLMEKGAAVKARNLAVLIYKLENLLKNPPKISQMAQNTESIARPDAAFKIVEQSLKLL